MTAQIEFVTVLVGESMKDLSQFVGPIKELPAMKVEVIDNTGVVISTFDAPNGFQLERYVDSLYPENEFMTYGNDHEINVSVIENHGIVEVYRGVYK